MGPWGHPCGQDPALCLGDAEHLQQSWLETPVLPRRPHGRVALTAQGERAGWLIPGRCGRALGSPHGAERAEEAQGRRKGSRGQA